MLNLLRHKYSRRLSELVSNTQMPFSCTLYVYVRVRVRVSVHVYASHTHSECLQFTTNRRSFYWKWFVVLHASYRERVRLRVRMWVRGYNTESVFGWVYSLMMTQYWTVRHFNYSYTLLYPKIYNICLSHRGNNEKIQIQFRAAGCTHCNFPNVFPRTIFYRCTFIHT